MELLAIDKVKCQGVFQLVESIISHLLRGKCNYCVWQTFVNGGSYTISQYESQTKYKPDEQIKTSAYELACYKTRNETLTFTSS